MPKNIIMGPFWGQKTIWEVSGNAKMVWKQAKGHHIIDIDIDTDIDHDDDDHHLAVLSIADSGACGGLREFANTSNFSIMMMMMKKELL